MELTFPLHKVSSRQETTASENSNSVSLQSTLFNNVTSAALFLGGNLVMSSNKCAVHNQRLTFNHLKIHVHYMLAACGHKFGECSTNVHILRLCECHLAVANSQQFLLKIMYRVFVGHFYWHPRVTYFITSASC